MADIKINELATSDISLSDFFAKADVNGLAAKNTIQGLSNLLNAQGSLTFRGGLAVADTPTLDGWYFASESGTYTNAGSLVVNITNNLVIIIVADTQTTFDKIDVPLSITFEGLPVKNSVNATESGGTYKALQTQRVFQPDANVPSSIVYAFKRIRIFGANRSNEYSLAIIKKNESGTNEWRLTIFPITGGVFGSASCEWVETSYTPSSNVEKIILTESGGSGVTAEITVKWDEIADNTVLSGRPYSETGLDIACFEDNATISDASKDVVLGQDLKSVKDIADANTTSIGTNATNISTNASNISSNTSSISTNASNITANKTSELNSKSITEKGLIDLNKNGQSNEEVTDVLSTSQNVRWDVNNAFDNRFHAVRYIMVATTIQNRIRLPFRRNYDATDITGDIIVKIGLNGKWFYTTTVKNADLVAWGINTQDNTNDSPESTMYPIDIPQLELKAGDDLYVAWGCVLASDKLTFQYDNSDATGTHYADRYIVQDNTDITTIETVPTVTSTNLWTMPVDFLFADYLKKKIEDTIIGVKSTETIVSPDKIYTVCNDIDQSDNGFATKNYSAVVYADHFFKLTENKEIYWDKTKSDKLPLYAPIAEDNSSYNGGVDVLTTPISEKLKGQINDVTVGFNHISTKASVGQNEFPKILFITDSTGQFLAERPLSATSYQLTYFSAYIRDLFYKDFQANSDSGHNALCMGVDDQTLWTVTGPGNPLRAGVESKGGWTTRDFLYEKDFVTDNNRFYDSAKVGLVKFSLSKYLERYKTLADDGVTRLSVGTTAGTEVTDANSHDLCTPTHVVIQTAFNDAEGNWSADIDLMIAEIKAEYPNMIIIISTIDASGSYFPERYPMFDKDDINMVGDSLHSKMFNLLNSAKAKEDVPNKVFYCPNYFIQPTAWGIAFRDVDPPENRANSDFQFKVRMGAGNNFHPGTYAHANWGYQLYSLIKYTLTL